MVGLSKEGVVQSTPKKMGRPCGPKKRSEFVDESFLTTEQLAEILERSPRTLGRWRTQRRIPYIRVPGRSAL